MNLFIPLKTKVYFFDNSMVSQNNLSVINPFRVKYLVGYVGYKRFKPSHIYRIQHDTETHLRYEHVIPYSFILEMCK